MSNVSERRVLILNLRSWRFGYVILEGPHTLLDWGVKTYTEEKRSSLERRLNDLQSMFAPSIILVRKAVEHNRVSQSILRPALRDLAAFAKRAFITMHLVDKSSLRGFFSRETKVNKYDIARMVVDRFPELSWRLPPKRRPWQSEPRRQSIFDAASLGVFYFAQQADE